MGCAGSLVEQEQCWVFPRWRLPWKGHSVFVVQLSDATTLSQRRRPRMMQCLKEMAKLLILREFWVGIAYFCTLIVVYSSKWRLLDCHCHTVTVAILLIVTKFPSNDCSVSLNAFDACAGCGAVKMFVVCSLFI